MSPKAMTNFRLEEEMIAALQRIRERDGIPVSEQVRRALQAWIELKGDPAKSSKKKR
jgi:Ribbon-helix-helix protein, copG family